MNPADDDFTPEERERRARVQRRKSPPPAEEAPPEFPRQLTDFSDPEFVDQGGFGVVFRAKKKSLFGVPFAIKIHKRRLDSKELERFRQEAQRLAQVRHDGVVQIWEYSQTGNWAYLVMDYVGGGTLDEYWGKNPPSPEQVAQMVARLAVTIHGLHTGAFTGQSNDPIVHRDLKPANVLLDEKGNPRISDFGLATALGQEAIHMGSLLYLAPEQLCNDDRATQPGVDIYALGGILYRGLTGHAPFVGRVGRSIQEQIQHDPPPPPRTTRADIPEDLEAICLKCLAKKSEQRYPDAQALGQDLQRFLDGQETTARRWSWQRRAYKSVRRNPKSLGSLAAAVVLLLIAIPTALYFWERATTYQLRADAEAQKAQAEKERARIAVDTAVDSTSDMVRKIAAEPNLKRGRLQGVRQEVLSIAMAGLDRIIAAKADTPSARAGQGRALLSRGVLHEEQGAAEASMKDVLAAEQLFLELAEEYPESLEVARGLAETRNSQGRTAIRFQRDLKSGLAFLHESATRFDALCEKSGNAEGFLFDRSKTRMNLGAAYMYANDTERGMKWSLQAADDLRELVRTTNHPQYRNALANQLDNIGMIHIQEGQIPKALERHKEALALREGLPVKGEHSPVQQQELASTLNHQGNALQALGRYKEAQENYTRSLAILKKLCSDPAEMFDLYQEQAFALFNRGATAYHAGDSKLARQSVDEGVTLLYDLEKKVKGIGEVSWTRRRGELVSAGLYLEMGESDKALPIYRRVAAETNNTPDRPTILEANAGAAVCHFRAKEEKAGREALAKAEKAYAEKLPLVGSTLLLFAQAQALALAGSADREKRAAQIVRLIERAATMMPAEQVRTEIAHDDFAALVGLADFQRIRERLAQPPTGSR